MIGALPIRYDGSRALARRALEVEALHPGLAHMLSGDVTSAFRHIPIHAEHVHRFAGIVPELGILVIDLACAFGWTNSPACYWTAGAAIQHLHSAHTPTVLPLQEPFDDNAWCDDHNCIEPAIGDHLREAELALREAMVTVLGPDACNDDKFTGWFRQGQALGLLWDFDTLTVAMPVTKIAKGRAQVASMLTSNVKTRLDLQRLLGSLQHVTTCVPAARPFFQRVATLLRAAHHSFRIAVSHGAKDDLR